MSYLWLNSNGKVDICDSGTVRISDCPDFDCRPICYVDKKATGTGDGSSWANAYTDIQTAINAKPYKEIRIKGYGENDCYPAGIELKECIYLKGIDDMWIDGEFLTNIGINGMGITSAKLDSINVKRCSTACFYGCVNLFSCKSKNEISYFRNGFTSCTNVEQCEAYNCWYGFYLCGNCLDCNSIENDGGFIFCTLSTNCTSTNDRNGAQISHTTLINHTSIGCSNCGIAVSFDDAVASGCTARGCGTGFYVNEGTFINCLAEDNQYCGFRTFAYNEPGIYINCQDINNCLDPNSMGCKDGTCEVV